MCVRESAVRDVEGLRPNQTGVLLIPLHLNTCKREREQQREHQGGSKRARWLGISRGEDDRTTQSDTTLQLKLSSNTSSSY